jgi:hypothetical protein
MNVIGCKNFNREIDELGLGEEPNATTRAHLQTCASCRGFYEDRLKLRQMIADLDPVAAPGDFSFRLRARMAKERGRTAAPFSIAGFRFGLPSMALAIVAILAGVGLYMRTMSEPQVQQSIASDAGSVVGPAALVENKGPEMKLKGTDTAQSNQNAEAIVDDQAVAGPRERPRSRKGIRNASIGVRRDDFLAKSDTAMFPLEAAEPLRVSVDYATGGSRTISLPAVSFGSQQVVASGASMVKTSARTVW